MKIWAISDTHMQHGSLIQPLSTEGIDTVILAGDSTNKYNWVDNQVEFEQFYSWFCNLPFKNKILIAGNHDAWATKKYNVDRVKADGIKYLEHDYLELDGKLIFGSPYTPTFFNWHFMVDRAKINRYWESLVEGIDILITHGPPKGILDLSKDRSGKLEFCGDSALAKSIFKVTPKYHVFGHIHDSDGCYNSGVLKIHKTNTTFVNASVVTDNRFDIGCSSHGNIFTV